MEEKKGQPTIYKFAPSPAQAAGIIGIVFMAPGAVMVAGNITREQNGKIAIAGPISNLILYSIGLVFGGLLLGISGTSVNNDESII